MLLSPLLSYVTLGLLGLFSILKFIIVIVNIYGFIFLIYYRDSIKIPRASYFLLIWIFYLIVWSFFNNDLENEGVNAFLKRSRLLAIFFMLVIIYNSKFRDKFIYNSIFLFKITVIVSVIVSVIQVFTPSFFNAWVYWRNDIEYSSIVVGNIYEVRRSSIFGFIDPNALGLSFIPMVSVLVGYLLYNKNKNYLVYFLFGIIVAILSNSRYIIIASIIITIQIIFYENKIIKSYIKYLFVTILSVLVIFLLLIFLEYDFVQYAETRLFKEENIAQSTRYAAIINFIEFYPRYPVFGNGDIYNPDVIAASNFFGSSHIHVGYLSHLVAYGFVGCFFLFGFWFLILKRLYKTAKTTGYWGSVFGFLVFLWAFATFSQSSIFYTGLIYVFVFDKYFNDLINYK